MDKNQQAIKPRVLTEGLFLEVHSIFPTIQGEGPFSGHTAIFVRLAGCNLQCPLCDTEYTDGAEPYSIDQIIERIDEARSKWPAHLVVITGGEPFRQNISRLCKAITESLLMYVQVETNGRMSIQGDIEILRIMSRGAMEIVVSPKTGAVNKDIARFASAWKYVVHADQLADDLLPTQALDHPLGKHAHVARPPKEFNGPIYVHPVDVQDEAENTRHLQAAVKSVLEGGDTRRVLGIQLHKFIGVE